MRSLFLLQLKQAYWALRPLLVTVILKNLKYIFVSPLSFVSFSWLVRSYSDCPTCTYDLVLFFFCSIQYSFFVLCTQCFVYKMVWQVSFLVLFDVVYVHCSWIDISFPRFFKISSMILLKIFSLPLAWKFSPSMCMNHKFGLLIVLNAFTCSICIYY